MIKLTQKAIDMVVVVLIGLCCAACLNVKYQAKEQYLLNPIIAEKNYPTVYPGALLVGETKSIAPYNNLTLSYRISQDQYVTDYYHVWMASPSEQIYQVTQQYFTSTHLFKQVVTDESLLKAKYALAMKLLALYADYRQSDKPMAVIAMNVQFYGRDDQNQWRLLSTQDFEESIPLTQKSSTALIAGWQEGLSSLLEKTANQLQEMHFK